MKLNPSARAFTLIEVLIVISIIGVLVATLLPALSEARAHAQETKCVANMRAQYAGQSIYAVDSKDMFAEHSNPFPIYYKSVANNPLKTGPYQKLKPSYLPDGRIFKCTFMDSLGGIEADPFFSFSVYAGWGVQNPINGFYVYSTYSWFANFTSRQAYYSDTPDTITQVNDEPVWPRKLSEADSSRAVVTHLALKSLSGATSLDFTHRFVDPYFTGARPTGKSNPVGFGDGHVIVRSNSDMQDRVQIYISLGANYTHHWY